MPRDYEDGMKHVEKKYAKKKPIVKKEKRKLEIWKEKNGKKKKRCQHICQTDKQCTWDAISIGSKDLKYCRRHIAKHIAEMKKYEQLQLDERAKEESLLLNTRTSRHSAKFWEKLKVNDKLLTMEGDKLYSLEDNVKVADGLLEYIWLETSEYEKLKYLRPIIELLKVSSDIKEKHAKILQGENQTLHILTFKKILQLISATVYKCFGKDKEGIELFFKEMKEMTELIRDSDMLDGQPIKSIDSSKMI